MITRTVYAMALFLVLHSSILPPLRRQQILFLYSLTAVASRKLCEISSPKDRLIYNMLITQGNRLLGKIITLSKEPITLKREKYLCQGGRVIFIELTSEQLLINNSGHRGSSLIQRLNHEVRTEINLQTAKVDVRFSWQESQGRAITISRQETLTCFLDSSEVHVPRFLGLPFGDTTIIQNCSNSLYWAIFYSKNQIDKPYESFTRIARTIVGGRRPFDSLDYYIYYHSQLSLPEIFNRIKSLAEEFAAFSLPSTPREF